MLTTVNLHGQCLMFGLICVDSVAMTFGFLSAAFSQVGGVSRDDRNMAKFSNKVEKIINVAFTSKGDMGCSPLTVVVYLML